MNPAKYAFDVSTGNFLGFIVHHRGIEVNANKARAIIDVPPPTTKKQLQSLLGKINFLRRFVANSAGKMAAFFTLLKLKDSNKFEWREEHQAAVTQIKVALVTPPVLITPRRDKNPLSYTFQRPKNPSVASSHKILMLGENKLFSISAETSALQKLIIHPKKTLLGFVLRRIKTLTLYAPIRYSGHRPDRCHSIYAYSAKS
ncbi:hypothetical protein COP1_035486 [Malus domestica]